ncbi:hypothetical protein SAMN06265360_12636 [Haloechinothrix alba]|uniref:Uncharacterized protein n=1 Tax=Haloechinothrix alba TaxID=664784 RepID=A0A238ZW39_9PSEU|nr:RRQRL motif-containing zinc-binding protein [Haloechinothrix alba]SNR87459.1 hypothetical protein SAMN06265360_12636 [Haloechinothrix alba]
MARRLPWDLRPVPWSDVAEFTRGTFEGLPLLSWGLAPHDRLATRRQLRAMGLRPGGQDPVALLMFRHRAAYTRVVAELFLISQARPVRAMTPARWRAVHTALAARRTCGQCGTDTETYLPRQRPVCEPCRYRLGELDADDYLHDYLAGEPIAAPQVGVAA